MRRRDSCTCYYYYGTTTCAAADAEVSHVVVALASVKQLRKRKELHGRIGTGSSGTPQDNKVAIPGQMATRMFKA